MSTTGQGSSERGNFPGTLCVGGVLQWLKVSLPKMNLKCGSKTQTLPLKAIQRKPPPPTKDFVLSSMVFDPAFFWGGVNWEEGD